ncbi:efflux RND transporter periplasmic adaptor subunit [Neorhodopirellula lusitana]|uniref:efflux RND transporter periplasmic adaptor subunit n=1 Tax=Neorhodopirellula lusitana TaxID=445327 RepID=UPI00384B14AF
MTTQLKTLALPSLALAVVPWILVTAATEKAIAQDISGVQDMSGVQSNSGVQDPLLIQDAQALTIQDTVIASPIAGLVRGCPVKEGDLVAPTQLIAELDDTRARKELSAAQAAYQAALIQADNDVNTRYARRTLDVRRRELMQSKEANQRYSGSVTATEMDRLQLVIDQAELSVEQAQQEQAVAHATANEKAATVDLGQLRVDEHQIRSQISGRVAEVAIQTGQWIEAGAPVARIVSLNPIRVSGFLDGRKFDRSLVGRPVSFQRTAEKTLDSSPTVASVKLTGTVTFVSDELNPVTSQVRLWAEVSNPDEAIRPGMRGRLVIEQP